MKPRSALYFWVWLATILLIGTLMWVGIIAILTIVFHRWYFVLLDCILLILLILAWFDYELKAPESAISEGRKTTY
jgi:hypothetical protein